MGGSNKARTRNAVKRFLSALNASLYEVGIGHPHHGMMLRTFDAGQIYGNIDWLRHRNACGCDIYIRPAYSHGIVMLDDLDSRSVSRLRDDGLEPCAVVETSRGNFHVWIRLIYNREMRSLDIRLIRALLATLAAQYGADPNATDWRHFGRLPGFTNRKPSRILPSGRSPFVLLRSGHPIVATRGREYLIKARLRLTVHRSTTPTPLHGDACQKVLSYQDRILRILSINHGQPWTLDPDPSRLDFMVAREMLAQGMPTSAVRGSLLDSPRIGIRKAGHVDDYIERTIKATLDACTLYPAPSSVDRLSYT